MSPSPWWQAVFGAFKPKIDFNKGDAGWAVGGAVIGGVVDLALLPVGVVTLGTGSAMGAGAGYACKGALDSAVKKWHERIEKKKARERSAKAQAFADSAPSRANDAITIFEKNGFAKGKDDLRKYLELHSAKLMSNAQLNRAVDAAIKEYGKWTPPQASGTPFAPDITAAGHNP
jgi:hypothetical protein